MPRDELRWSHGDGLVLRGLAELPVRPRPRAGEALGRLTSRMPSSVPRRTASRRLATCSFDSSADTWWSTVLVEMNSRSAISALVDPSASRARISTCRLVSPAGFGQRRLAPARRDHRGAAAPQVLADLGGHVVGAEPVEQVEPGARAVRRAGVDEGERLVVRRRQRRPHRRRRRRSARRAAAGRARRRRPGRDASDGRPDPASASSRRSHVASSPRAHSRPAPDGRWPAAARHSLETGVGDAPQPRPLDQRRRPPAAAGSARRTDGPGAHASSRSASASPPRRSATNPRTRCGHVRASGALGPASTTSASATASAQSPRSSFIRPREPSCHTRQMGRSRSIVSGRVKPSSSAACRSRRCSTSR